MDHNIDDESLELGSKSWNRIFTGAIKVSTFCIFVDKSFSNNINLFRQAIEKELKKDLVQYFNQTLTLVT